MSTTTTMTGLAATQTTGHAGSVATSKWVQRTKLYFVLFALMAPTLIGMLLFTYYPQFDTVRYSFYRWDGSVLVREFRGLENYVKAFTQDSRFWASFSLVLILLAANVIKMWPSIFASVVLHRLRSESWQYIYRVLFVIPMIIPAIVGLLVWKSFFDPQIGPLNKFLNLSGGIGALNWLDGAMPSLAKVIAPVFTNVIDPLFHSVWGMFLFGVLVLSSAGGLRQIAKSWLWWGIVAATLFFTTGTFHAFVSPVPTEAAAQQAAVDAGPGDWVYLVRFLALGFVAVGVGEAMCRWKGILGRGYAIAVGVVILLAASVFVLLGMIWTEPTNAFSDPNNAPSWLSNTKLIIPSLIIWGFPWIGTVGVLIYLAGLQNISTDVYEAAEIDGVGSIGKLFYLELPLIMTQVRINLIFLTIGTLTDYGLVLLLLGPSGGPGSVGMVPGLYMYSKGFTDGEFGYACALGMVLFVIILSITILYQKYVKVDK